MSKHFLNTLFEPKNIAVIGASNNLLKIGHIVAKNILESGYKGQLFLINPKEKEILANPVFNDLDKVKNILDQQSLKHLELAIICIPAKFTPQILEELANLKTKFAIIISAGFKEIGNLELENKIIEIAQKNQIKILGPNCLGLLNLNFNELAYNGSFAFKPKLNGNISLISQSGALVTSFLDKADRRGFGFNKVISLGNKSDLNEIDFVDFLDKDSQTDIIAIYLEGFSQAKKLIKLLSQVQKPVIIIKAGRTPKTQIAISSHTGSIAGDEKIADLYLKEIGAILPKSLEEFFSTLFLFSKLVKTLKSKNNLGQNQNTSSDLISKEILKPNLNRNLVILTNAGGGGVLALDALIKTKITCEELPILTQNKLKNILPKAASSHNPVDILGDSDSQRYQKALQIILEEKSVLSVMVILTPQANTEIQKTAENLVKLTEDFPQKVILPVFVGGDKIHSAIKIFRQNNLPYFDTPDEALEALDNWYKFRFNNKNQEFLDPELEVKPNSKINLRLSKKSHSLEFDQIQKITKKFDLPLVKSSFINSKNYEEIFEKFDKPVVLKVVSSKELHRTDKNMVLVEVKKIEDVKKFVTTFEREKILIQEIVKNGVEVFVGIKKDWQFGCSLVMGSGGIYAEIWNDLVLAPIPITKKTIHRFLSQTKLFRFLTGYRNKFYDLDFLVENIYKITLLAQTYPQISSIDINPFIIQKKGGKIVDFKVILESKLS
jgi:acetate---CoA ligase (ADP-forming)